VLQGMILTSLDYFEKVFFCLILNAIFEVVKMIFGTKLWASVSLHTALS